MLHCDIRAQILFTFLASLLHFYFVRFFFLFASLFVTILLSQLFFLTRACLADLQHLKNVLAAVETLQSVESAERSKLVSRLITLNIHSHPFSESVLALFGRYTH